MSVGTKSADPPAIPGEAFRLLHPLGVDVGGDHRGAGRGERQRDRPAHSACRSGDEGDVASEVGFHRSHERSSHVGPSRNSTSNIVSDVLLGIDEYPFHQVTDTFAAVAGSDPSWNDGHYICAADRAGEIAFTSNVRLYANNDVLDGFVCLRHRDRQYNVRVCAASGPDMEYLCAGPLRLEIVEPLGTVRLVLDENAVGIALDVTCHTANVPYMGPIEIRRLEGG